MDHYSPVQRNDGSVHCLPTKLLNYQTVKFYLISSHWGWNISAKVDWNIRHWFKEFVSQLISVTIRPQPCLRACAKRPSSTLWSPAFKSCTWKRWEMSDSKLKPNIQLAFPKKTFAYSERQPKMYDQQETFCSVRKYWEKLGRGFVHINASISKQQIKRFDLE